MRTARAAGGALVLAMAGCNPATTSTEPQTVESVDRPAEDCDAEPSRTKVIASFDAVVGEVRACAPQRTKVVRIAATFASGGEVTDAEVLGPSGEPRRYPSQGTVMNLAAEVEEHDGTIAGTPAATCMADAVRKARTHPFCDVSLLAIYPFQP